MSVKSLKPKKGSKAISRPGTATEGVVSEQAGMSQAVFYELMGARISALRRQAGLTQADLAAKIGLKRASITHIESGMQKPLPHALYLLAHFLDVDLEKLFPPSIKSRKNLREAMDSLDPAVRETINSFLPPQR
jgi:transcriptional regulator with XRE-family HTH domain